MGTQGLEKCATGISGLDAITGGGFPRNRTTLLCGGPGCGKTLMAIEFLVRGATTYGEPGVFVAFEETPEELAANVKSLGFDLAGLSAEGRLFIDKIELPYEDVETIGDYDLEGLFVRLGYAINSIGAKRIVLDTLETLFAGMINQSILRAELRRLFSWCKSKGVTAVITCERGQSTLTRYGLEEYVSDCVLLLDNRVESGVSTRRLRIVKYRGSFHGTNEYPFLIDEQGISAVPITSVGLDHIVSKERISSGVARLDEMLGGSGYYRGSSVLISGMAGTGKTTLAASFSDATCRRGERVVYFGFEESLSQFARNMASVGLDFGQWADRNVFSYEAARPSLQGLEAHLVSMYRTIERNKPCAVVVDPVSTFVGSSSNQDVKSMLMRLIDHIKTHRVTAVVTSLMHDEANLETTDVGVSSLMDTWLLLRTFEDNGERNRGLFVLKSRGMAHSNQIREFTMSKGGIELHDVYVGPEGVLTGSARLFQERKDRERSRILALEAERRQQVLDRKRQVLDAQIATLNAEFEAEKSGILASSTAEQELLREELGRRVDTGKTRTLASKLYRRLDTH